MGFFTQAADRLDLMNKMMEQTDTHIDEHITRIGAQNLRSAITACLGCKQAAACEKWLQEPKEKAEAPGFCANSDLMNGTKSIA